MYVHVVPMERPWIDDYNQTKYSNSPKNQHTRFKKLVNEMTSETSGCFWNVFDTWYTIQEKAIYVNLWT